MKKIALIIGIMGLLTVQNLVFADEIVDSKGVITPCKIITVSDGFVEYEQNGCLNTFCRNIDQPVFNDYVDVRTKLFAKHETITRYCGTLVMKDFGGVTIRTTNGIMNIPWYRVKFVGVYKP